MKKTREIKYDKTLPKNLPLMFQDRALTFGNSVVQAAKNKEGKFENYTYKQVYQEIIAFAAKLRDLGIKRGNLVGLISDNRREWMITDFAIMSLGACDVPRGCDSMGKEIRFILNYVKCDFSFFENAKQLQKVLEDISEVPSLKVAILYCLQ
jgi:long-chain acyl-CoA synthetase